jgi:hypothetical protein
MSPPAKHLLRPERVRKVPRSFSWVDHRLIRDGHLERLQPGEILLYFFLVLVGDHQGLSFYSPRSISRQLKLTPEEIESARTSLCERSLIAYKAPLYQVLSLPERTDAPASRPSARRGGEAVSIGEILSSLLGKKPVD